MNVVELHPGLACEDIVKALRNIADDLEAGEYDFKPNMAVLVIAREEQKRDGSGFTISYDWQTHGLGERTSFFAAKGILAASLSRFETSE